MTGETRMLSTTVNESGGYSVIPELDTEIMRMLADESVMRQIYTVKTTKSNEYKKLVSVGGAAVGRGIEGEARDETATPKLEEVSIKLNPIYAYPKTTQEILDFSDVDILGWLTEEISDTFAETEETDLVSGDGTKKSKGFLSYPREAKGDRTRPFGTLEKMVSAGATLTADELSDLVFKLRRRYRRNAVWTMNSNTAAMLQKLKNGNGDYIRYQGETPWMGEGAWKACATDYTEAELVGLQCYAGLDLSSTSDITSVCYTFPLERSVRLLTRHYIPEAQLQNPANKNRTLYRQWVKQGWLRTTPGDCIDYDRIRDDVLADAERFSIELVGFDTWNATQIRTQLQSAGLDVEPFPQTYMKFSPMAKSAEAFVNRKVIEHNGDPVLA